MRRNADWESSGFKIAQESVCVLAPSKRVGFKEV